MKLNLRLFVSAFVLSAISSALIFVTPPFLRVSAQSTKQLSAEAREDAYRANNLGAAYLEQYNHQAGAAAFRRALELNPQMTFARVNLAIALFNLQDLDAALRELQIAVEAAPQLPQPHYILGLIAKNQNRTEDAVASLKRVLEIDPRDVGANVNLGQIYAQQRRYAEAVAVFRIALDAEPYNATAMYSLGTALLRNNQREEGQQWITRFQTLRQSGAATSIGQNYLEQGRYAEAIVSTGAESELVDKTVPKIVFQNVNIGLPVSKSKKAVKLFDKVAALLDFDGDGDLDIAQTVPAKLFRNDKGKFVNVTSPADDFAKAGNLFCYSIIAGDYDGDGRVDLFVSWDGKFALYRNTGEGKFLDVTGKSKLPNLRAVASAAAFVDVDHDGDLDIVLNALEKISNFLFRNNGDGSFTDISESSGVNQSTNSVSIIPTDYDNRRDIDLFFLPLRGTPILLRNLRNGSFRDVAAEVGLAIEGNFFCAAVGDFNKDSFVDFFFGRGGQPGVFAVSDGRGKFVIKDAPKETTDATAALFLDYDNDGLLDLVVNTTKGLVLSRNLGDGWTKANGQPFKTNLDLSTSKQILSADIDSDGDLDLLIYAKNGTLQFLRNDGGNANNSEILRLQGRVSNKTGIGAKIDMRAGSLTQKLESYSTSPASAPSEIHFGLGKRQKTDAVRVLWTSGIVQSEIKSADVATAKNNAPVKIEELDRKPSSCPYLYTWNGERFEFITDFLGGGEMGNWQKAGAYHYPDPDEFVRITSDQLKPKDGKYEIRVTNELEEVLFLDHLKLVAVEHNADSEVYPNEGLGIPTAGTRVLYTTANARPPLSAVNSDERDVLSKIEKLDRAFYDDFKSLNIRGYAETHNLTLDLDNKKGFDGRTLLLLTGWTDYAFSSDNLAASQSGKSLFLPKLQVKNKRGEWQTVIDGIGISVGRPQTLVVDLTDKFLSDSREVRIVTNFKTYWDKIEVDTSAQADVKTIELQAKQANLRERGFSEEIKYGEMIAANYDKVFNDGRWKYFSGNFTKLGAVSSLLEAVDDVFVISKTGDEIVLSFNALPDLPKNKKYTFLLFADGYSKEMDINSGSPEAVFPLPFKQMKKYPYDADEQFPMTDEKRRLYDEYTTRPVKGFLPRFESAMIK